MWQSSRSALVLLVALMAGATEAADPKFEVQLKRAWVEFYKDRASVDANMVIHHSHQHPNTVGSGSDDGDLHFSGESKEIGLPFVAEVTNAASETKAVEYIKKVAAENEETTG